MGVLVMALSIPTKSEGKSNSPVKQSFTGAKGEVKIITLDPGHFHAALVQKKMYDQVNADVHVYAPEGSDVAEHLKRIDAYNNRKDSPTSWKEIVYKGNDYFTKMLNDKQGNVVVLAGNNRIKTEYIKKSVEAGFNVLADKPMVISPENFPMLEESFKIAVTKGVILYDIMTERHEITTMLQKELSQNPVIFGSLQKGTKDKPAVEKLSVHYFYKNVSGVTLVRPGWFFDVDQQGEGIVDVATHLIDLVQWICFPGVVLKKSDIEMLQARHWPTILTLDEFKAVTQLDKYPDYLSKAVKDGKLNEYANGEMTYKIKGVFAKVTAEWHYKAPEGSGDTHYSVLRGTKGTLEILQGEKEKYMPTLYIHANPGAPLSVFKAELEKSILKNTGHAGLNLEKVDESTWKVIIPDQYKVGHEAHFSQVTEKYLDFLKSGKLPEWEVPNMIVKYYTATEALKMARK
jgi:predicted dehydrogenase